MWSGDDGWVKGRRSGGRLGITGLAGVIGVSAWVGGAGAARAEGDAKPPSVEATMECESGARAGRVRCSVDLRAEGGVTVGWADVVIVAVPEFATALKGRLGPKDTTTRDPTRAAWAFALIARRGGEGEIRARVRVAVCDAGEPSRCAPVEVTVRTTLTVG